MNWGTFKPKLGEAIVAHLAPIQAKYNEVMQDPSILDKVGSYWASTFQSDFLWVSGAEGKGF